ncbi:uncharacterized protein TRIADDRAFT_19077 [Trichoplax adhaerens]|uniref:Mannosyl-oligosaccharide glucosidase n=1 Tax=Trichoplax adhaerens TaxID=10228 RepID=B3RIA9_TRIAD|nr:hypothetical protein TRIADDRAFT_19077 [Trichoplax adhaerens]EDV29719.1 hypothetical protein TRIADDRAFT_19077 [Trichoplax adhaerens]|eukprot:XP_002108921.1 hypothetical protein TRIADDRAFT_19077 [Trichoplax adhaerens]
MNRFWGSYRPQVYFGMRHKGQKSLITGLMWFANDNTNGQIQIRHECSMADKLPKYGWYSHDGSSYGRQQITDFGYEIKTDFVTRSIGDYGGDWSVRISSSILPGSPKNREITLIFYVGQEGTGELFPELDDDYNFTGITGNSNRLKNFKIAFRTASSSQNIKLRRYLSTNTPYFYSMKEFVSANMRPIKSERNVRYYGLFDGRPTNDPTKSLADNLILYQVTGRIPIEFEIIYESQAADNVRAYPVLDNALTHLIKTRQEEFNKKFEEKFKLGASGFNNDYIQFGKAALSSTLGGIGYFHGESKVISEFFKDATDYFEAPLLTGTPSRSFFPRGFLWDEGFHQLLICKWDLDLSMEIIAYWLDLINAEGWIPREQILGDEARSRVPAKFIVQNNRIANPPTLMLALHSIQSELEAKNKKLSKEHRLYFQLLFPKLHAWFNWFNSTQRGNIPGTFRWQGRSEEAVNELNAKTLASGLDDYPRASHPSVAEAHVDLRCWMTAFVGYMHHLAVTVDKRKEAIYYARQFVSLSDVLELDRLHWSPRTETYCDYGNHTKYVKLKKVLNAQGQVLYTRRVVSSKKGPSLRFVHHFGYVNLFPFLMHLLPASSTNLKKILEDLSKPELLWTDYGLRSLAKTDTFYFKWNTESDPPYWRGPIWINMNFLVVRALHFYRSVKGPYKEVANDLYIKLRNNVVNTVFKEYQRTGYFWENYDPQTGKGQGAHPFNGWTSLVLLMMAENY